MSTGKQLTISPFEVRRVRDETVVEFTGWDTSNLDRLLHQEPHVRPGQPRTPNPDSATGNAATAAISIYPHH